MTMNFSVLPEVDISEVEVGQDIHFSMLQQDSNRYVIDQVHVLKDAGQVQEHDHD